MTKDNELAIKMELALYDRAVANDPYMSDIAKEYYLSNSNYYELLKRNLREDSK